MHSLYEMNAWYQILVKSTHMIIQNFAQSSYIANWQKRIIKKCSILCLKPNSVFTSITLDDYDLNYSASYDNTNVCCLTFSCVYRAEVLLTTQLRFVFRFSSILFYSWIELHLNVECFLPLSTQWLFCIIWLYYLFKQLTTALFPLLYYLFLFFISSLASLLWDYALFSFSNSTFWLCLVCLYLLIFSKAFIFFWGFCFFSLSTCSSLFIFIPIIVNIW